MWISTKQKLERTEKLSSRISKGLNKGFPPRGETTAQGWNHFFFYPNLSTWASGTPPGGVADTLLLKNRSEDMLLLKFCK